MASRFGLAEVLLAEWKATRKSRPSLRLLLSLGLSVCPSACPSVTVERTERATTLAQQEEDTTNAAATALTASAAPPVPSSLPPSLATFVLAGRPAPPNAVPALACPTACPRRVADLNRARARATPSRPPSPSARRPSLVVDDRCSVLE